MNCWTVIIEEPDSAENSHLWISCTIHKLSFNNKSIITEVETSTLSQ